MQRSTSIGIQRQHLRNTKHTQSLFLSSIGWRLDRSHSHNGRPAAAARATSGTVLRMSALPCLPHDKTGSNLGRAQGGISLRVKVNRASAYTGCQSTSNLLAKDGSYQQELPCMSSPTDSSPLLMLLSQPQLLSLLTGGLGPSFEPLLSQDAETPAR